MLWRREYLLSLPGVGPRQFFLITILLKFKSERGNNDEIFIKILFTKTVEDEDD
jgi:hypothetical protein